MESNMDLIGDMFEGHLIYEDMNELQITEGESKEYYQGKAEFMLTLLDDSSYFEFMKVFSKRFSSLTELQKKEIQERLGIVSEPSVVYREKIVYREKNKKKKIRKLKNSKNFWLQEMEPFLWNQ